MSFSLTFPFNTPSNYTINNTVITDSKTQLDVTALPDQDFTEDFADDTGFTYDSDKSQFVAGQNQQKDQRPTGYVLFDSFRKASEADWGQNTITRTLENEAAIVDGELDCSNNQYKKAVYNADNFSSSAEVMIDLKYKADFSGTPEERIGLIRLGESANVASNVRVRINADGALIMWCYDSEANLVINLSYDKNDWVDGQEYRFQAFVKSGDSRFYFDGESIGNSNAIFTRNNNEITKIQLGAHTTNRADTIFTELYVGGDVLSYNTSLTYNPYIYAITNVTLPELAYTGAGTLIELTNLVATSHGSERYTIQIGRSGDYLYWNGSAWVVSDDTYAQASPVSDFVDHGSSLPVSGEIYGQFRIHYTVSNTQGYVSNLVVTVTAQQYFASGITKPNQAITSEKVESVSFTDETIPASTTLTYIAIVNGNDKYWDGTAWVDSDGTVSQSNSSTELSNNIDTLISKNATLEFKILHETSDTNVSSSLGGISLEYNFAGRGSDALKCIIWGFYKDIRDEPVNGATVEIELVRNNKEYKSASNNIIEKSYSITTGSSATNPNWEDGYFEVPLIYSSEYNNTASYYISITKTRDGLETSEDSSGNRLHFEVPDLSEKDITEILNAL